MDYKAELLAMLGLPAEATDEQITAAYAEHKQKLANSAALAGERDALLNRAQAAEAEVAKRDQQILSAQVEIDLEQFKDRIANRDQVKAQLLANRAGTLVILQALKPAGAEEPLRIGGREPHPETEEQKLNNRLVARDALINQVQKELRCSTRAEAYELARKRQPELFT
jgi:hypothetical protein